LVSNLQILGATAVHFDPDVLRTAMVFGALMIWPAAFQSDGPHKGYWRLPEAAGDICPKTSDAVARGLLLRTQQRSVKVASSPRNQIAPSTQAVGGVSFSEQRHQEKLDLKTAEALGLAVPPSLEIVE